MIGNETYEISPFVCGDIMCYYSDKSLLVHGLSESFMRDHKLHIFNSIQFRNRKTDKFKAELKFPTSHIVFTLEKVEKSLSFNGFLQNLFFQFSVQI